MCRTDLVIRPFEFATDASSYVHSDCTGPDAEPHLAFVSRPNESYSLNTD
ncbi:MAG: hypothetical protein V9E99_12000 [Microthrixaceae bacterium]